MSYLRLMFSGIDEAEVKDLDYCLLFILCYSRFIRSGLKRNLDGWQHLTKPPGLQGRQPAGEDNL